MVDGLLTLLQVDIIVNGGLNDVDFAKEVRESMILKGQFATNIDFLDLDNLANVSYLIHVSTPTLLYKMRR